jgi:hypothetical protein
VAGDTADSGKVRKQVQEPGLDRESDRVRAAARCFDGDR